VSENALAVADPEIWNRGRKGKGLGLGRGLCPLPRKFLKILSKNHAFRCVYAIYRLIKQRGQTSDKMLKMSHYNFGVRGCDGICGNLRYIGLCEFQHMRRIFRICNFENAIICGKICDLHFLPKYAIAYSHITNIPSYISDVPS